MEKISCSCTWGDGNINHNFNKKSRSRQEHIDKTRIDDNIILKEISEKTIEQEFNKIFAEDVKEYNEKQKRNDRKIISYYQKVKNDKKIRAPFREVIYQVGNKDNSKDPEIREKMINVLIKFYDEFESNYPRLKIIGGAIHLDEACPHLHLDVVPYAEGNKKGMKHKVSFEKAIEQMGFVPEQSEVNKDEKAPLIFNGFRNHSMRLLEELLNGVGMQRDIMHNTEKHLSVKQFKEKMAIEDLKKSPEIQEKALNEILDKSAEKEGLEGKIEYLRMVKQEEKEEFEEFELEIKEKKKALAEDYERKKREYNAKLVDMQNELTFEKVLNKAVEKLDSPEKIDNKLRERNSQLEKENQGLKWYQKAYEAIIKRIAKVFRRNSKHFEDEKNEDLKEIIGPNEYVREDFKKELDNQHRKEMEKDDYELGM